MASITETCRSYRVSRTEATLLLIVLTLLYILNYADRAILSVVLQPMKISLRLSDAEAGIIQSAFSLGVCLLTLPGAFLMERWSRRKTLSIMAIIWSVATIATGLCSRVSQLVVARFLVGLGEGSFAPGGNAWLSVVFPKKERGKISGIFGIGTALGTIIGMALGGYIVTKTGDWRIAFYVFGVPGIILGVLTFFFKDYATVKEDSEAAFSKEYLSGWIRLFKIRSFALTVVGHSIFLLFFFTFLGWLPAFMMRGYDLNAAQAGGLLGVIFLLGVPVSPLGGWLADLWLKRSNNGRAKFMLVGHLANFIVTVALLLVYGGPLSVFIVLLVIQGIIVGCYTSQIYSIISDVIPIKYRISGFSLLNTFIFSIGALGPWLIGIISDALGGGAYGLQMGFLVLLPALAIGALFCFFMTRNYAEDSARCSDEVFHERA